MSNNRICLITCCKLKKDNRRISTFERLFIIFSEIFAIFNVPVSKKVMFYFPFNNWEITIALRKKNCLRGSYIVQKWFLSISNWNSDRILTFLAAFFIDLCFQNIQNSRKIMKPKYLYYRSIDTHAIQNYRKEGMRIVFLLTDRYS